MLHIIENYSTAKKTIDRNSYEYKQMVQSFADAAIDFARKLHAENSNTSNRRK